MEDTVDMEQVVLLLVGDECSLANSARHGHTDSKKKQQHTFH